MSTIYHAAAAYVGTLRVEVLGHNAALGKRLVGTLQTLYTRAHTPAGYARGINAMLDGTWCRVECPGGYGVSLTRTGGLRTWQRFTVDAAHYLPAVPAEHPCSRMHGHSFQVFVHTRATLKSLRRACYRIRNVLDHKCMNNVPGLENPTSERLADWILKRLTENVDTTGVTVLETPTTGCHYEDGVYHLWKHFSFEAAVQGRYGHGYQLCLHLTAPLNAATGWTIDYGEISTRLAPVIDALDHRDLDATAANPQRLIRHIHEQAIVHLPIHQLELYAGPRAIVLTTGQTPYLAPTPQRHGLYSATCRP